MHIWARLKNNAHTRRESFPLILGLFYFTASNSKERKVPDHSPEALGVPYVDTLLPGIVKLASLAFQSPFHQPHLVFLQLSAVLMILFLPSATRKKHKIITQALVIIKPVIETKQQEENLKLVFQDGRCVCNEWCLLHMWVRGIHHSQRHPDKGGVLR